MNWKFRRIILTPESGVAIHKSRVSEQFTATLDYLPGSVVRGAFAQIFINKRGTSDPGFHRFFVEQRLRFSDFLPSNVKDSKEGPWLLPCTAMACKREKFDHSGSLKDGLLAQVAAKILSQRVDAESSCPVCRGDLARVEQRYVQSMEVRNEVVFSKQLRMHVGVSRATGSAVSRMLFSHELLSRKLKPKIDLCFIGTLATPQNEAEETWKRIDEVMAREHLSVGAARARGYGEFTIEFAPELSERSIVDRFQDFNKELKEAGVDEDKCFFSITFLSPLILRDQVGRPILGDIEGRHLGLPDDTVLEHAVLSARTVSGWNPALGMPKPDSVALERGSVVVFSAPESPDVRAKLLQQFTALENDGVGERRAEGFGQVRICHPFHLKPKQEA